MKLNCLLPLQVPIHFCSLQHPLVSTALYSFVVFVVTDIKDAVYIVQFKGLDVRMCKVGLFWE